jgi:tetratricopeptide (TPR) repeat protein
MNHTFSKHAILRAALGLALLVATPACSAWSTSKSAQTAAANRRSPETAEDFEAIGDAALRAGDTSRAEQYFQLALGSGGDSRRLRNKAIRACVADGRYLLARDHAKDYIRKHPGDMAFRLIYASLMIASGDLDRGQEELERVLKAAPNMATAHYTLGTLLAQKPGHRDAATEHFEAYLALDPEGDFADSARAYLSEAMP